MEFRSRIYGYCERGFEAGPGADAFWAEPLNAVTNGAFIIAAILGLVLALRGRRLDGPVGWLITLTFCVGVGSFLFHTYAMVWAAMTDTIPILLFILSYFAISMRCYGGFGWGRSLVLVVCFLVLLLVTSTFLRFGTDALSGAWSALTDTADENWLRQAGGVVLGTVLAILAAWFVGASLGELGVVRTTMALAGWAIAMMLLSDIAMDLAPQFFPGARSYLPALMALAGVGTWLAWKGHPAGRWMLVVAAIFTLSLTARALDHPLCATVFVGTHWLWHVLNGVVLGTLIVALIRHGTRPLSGRAG